MPRSHDSRFHYYRLVRRDSCSLCNVHQFRPLLRPPDDFCSPSSSLAVLNAAATAAAALDDDKLLLLILVHSRPGSWGKRAAIRQTWASAEMRQRHGFRVLFVFGDVRRHEAGGRQPGARDVAAADTTQSLQHALEAESRQFGDILQTDFEDTYANVTLKALSGLDFATGEAKGASSNHGVRGTAGEKPAFSCRDAFHYVAKVDDDVFLNINNVAKYLRENRKRYE